MAADPGRRGSRAWRLAAGAALAAAAALAYFFGYEGPKVEVATVVRRDVVQTVVASGRVATPYRVDVGSQVVGTVAEVPVREGQAVRAGQPLVVLESSEARAMLRQAEVAVAQAEARMRQLRELQLPVASQSLLQAEANLANARAQFERTARLHDSGFVGQAALDEARRASQVAQTQADSAREQLETVRPSGSDHALAVAALEQARAGRLAAQARLAYATLRAAYDGTLIARNVERGDVVQPGKVLMVLAPAGETQVVLQLDERNLGKLKVGQPALVSADAFPSQRFAAELTYVNPGVDAQRGTVEVKLRVPEPPAYLRQDMTVSVDIEVARRPQALAVPADALREASGPAPWVLVISKGRAQRRPVELGLRGEGWVEVFSGPAEGEFVVPAGNSRIKEGQRLRPAPNA